jgi:hypothetical protein
MAQLPCIHSLESQLGILTAPRSESEAPVQSLQHEKVVRCAGEADSWGLPTGPATAMLQSGGTGIDYINPLP